MGWPEPHRAGMADLMAEGGSRLCTEKGRGGSGGNCEGNLPSSPGTGVSLVLSVFIVRAKGVPDCP